MDYRKILILFSISLTIPTSLLAETAVKSVDQTGNVTYSDNPRADAVSSTEVTIHPGPTQNEVDAAKQRVAQTKDQADKAQAERNEKAKEPEEERKAAAASKPEVIGDGGDQASKDAKCEAARARKLAPEREKYIEECVRDKVKDSREACERFYSDYGAQSGNRAPLYYDLPECVEALEFRKSYRQ